jgi:hypothetical protein
MMFAQISHYPRVSEWLFVEDTAINLAMVTSITFSADSAGAYAIVRLPGYRGDQDDRERGETWFAVRDPEVVQRLHAYVAQMAAPGPAR